MKVYHFKNSTKVHINLFSLSKSLSPLLRVFLTFCVRLSYLSKFDGGDPSFGRSHSPFLSPLSYSNFPCFYCFPLAFYPDLLCSSHPTGIPPCSSFFWFSAMNTIEVVRRAPMFPPARVFPAPPPSPCYLPLPVMLLVGFHELHLGSRLLLFSCRSSLLCGCAQEAEQSQMLPLLRRCLAVNKVTSFLFIDGFPSTAYGMWTLKVVNICFQCRWRSIGFSRKAVLDLMMIHSGDGPTLTLRY